MPSFNSAVRGPVKRPAAPVPDGEGNIFGQGSYGPGGNGSNRSPNDNFMRRMASERASKMMPQYGGASAASPKPDASEPPAPPTGAKAATAGPASKARQPMNPAPEPQWMKGQPDSGMKGMQEPEYDGGQSNAHAVNLNQIGAIGNLDAGVNGNMLDEMSLAPAPPSDMERMAQSAGGPDESYAAMRNMAQSAEVPAKKGNRFLGAMKAIGRGVKKLGGTPNGMRRQSEVMF